MLTRRRSLFKCSSIQVSLSLIGQSSMVDSVLLSGGMPISTRGRLIMEDDSLELPPILKHAELNSKVQLWILVINNIIKKSNVITEKATGAVIPLQPDQSCIVQCK
ncbi:hypothetical protein AVEN_255791-1 [Araneus ventricosus]|uniref:Uncharacterized protein n=1 Tax=Araneus ventricosus TaxID=182803 RepID=A0A4Y2QEU6_ARAVE|nr:hypothetical protein AVEN_255791-1 [Araneus ventricosus]